MGPMQATAMVEPELIRRAFLKHQLKVARAREHFADFAPLVTLDNLGNPIDYAPIHLAWVWHLTYCWNRGLHCVLMAPYEHGKTSGFAVPLITWLVGRNLQIRCKVISAGDANAAARVEGAKAILETPIYRQVFPGVRIGRKWTGREAFVDRKGGGLDPTIHARGVDTGGIGQRADVLIFDDVVDSDNSMEFLQRKKVKDRVHSKWMSRLNLQFGRVLWLATPWHQDDATHEIMAMTGWCTLIQRVKGTLDGYEQEVIGAGPDYLQSVTSMADAHYQALREFAAL